MILVVTEQRDGELRDVSFEMLNRGADLADERGEDVVALLMAEEADGLEDELTPWADEVLVATDGSDEAFNADVGRQVVSSVVDERDPSVVMLGHTAVGISLASPLAMEFERALVSNAVDCRWEDGELKADRETYDGKAIETVGYERPSPYFLTVRQAAFEAEEPPGRDGTVSELDPDIDEGQVYTEVFDLLEPETGDVDISQSDVLVSVGRGIEEEDNLDIIEDLAEALDADISGSRPVIDNGWLPDNRQVGQSGKSVDPDLYLAIGISGASQHVIGMKESDTIVAVNSDPDAPIFEVANYGIVDDLFDVVPELTDAAEQYT